MAELYLAADAHFLQWMREKQRRLFCEAELIIGSLMAAQKRSLMHTSLFHLFMDFAASASATELQEAVLLEAGVQQQPVGPASDRSIFLGLTKPRLAARAQSWPCHS